MLPGVHVTGNWPTYFPCWTEAISSSPLGAPFVAKYRLPADGNRDVFPPHLHAEYDFQFCLHPFQASLEKLILERFLQFQRLTRLEALSQCSPRFENLVVRQPK